MSLTSRKLSSTNLLTTMSVTPGTDNSLNFLPFYRGREKIIVLEVILIYITFA